jgi:glycosyltransferase involved in cell wall biosynthesis
MWVTDAEIKGSGYRNLSIPLCEGLTAKGHSVKVIGLGYHGEEHNLPFSLIPANNFNEVFAMIQNLWNMTQFEVLIVALDIPLQEMFLRQLQQRPFKYVGLMPIEADPLCASWAMVLMWMDKACIISKFGTEEAKKVGINAEYIEVGIDTSVWRLPTTEERTKIRKSLFGADDDTFVILTVADNQERKNLSAGMEIFKEFNKEVPNSRYALVTREYNQVGWRLRDYAQVLGINNNFLIFERGMDFTQLWATYAGADCFFMPSKAEGLCALPSTEVWTLNGKKKISTIDQTDMVISHTGEIRGVERLYSRKYSGKIYEISLPYGLPSIQVTPEHLILGAEKNKTGRGNNRIFGSYMWFPAHAFNVGDYVFYPRPRFTQQERIDLLDYLDNDKIGLRNDKIMFWGRNQYGKEFPHPRSKLLPRYINFSREFMRLVGYYISEGCQTDDGLSFSFHSDEVDLQQEVVYAIKELFGLKTKIDYKDRHRCQMWVYHRALGEVFGSMCGKGSHEKHLPDWALWLPDDMMGELLRALFLGDGTFSKSGQRTARYSTVSKELAEQIQFVLTRFGIMASLKTGKNRIEYTVSIYRPDLDRLPFYTENLPEIKKLSSKRIDIRNNTLDGMFIPIKSILSFDYDGDVYNLEVEKDNSYLTCGGVIHNCLPLLEAMAIGLPCVATNATGMKELLSDGRGFLIDPEYIHVDPFGDGHRYWINKDITKNVLLHIHRSGKLFIQQYTSSAREFVEQRHWQIGIDKLDEVLKGL